MRLIDDAQLSFPLKPHPLVSNRPVDLRHRFLNSLSQLSESFTIIKPPWSRNQPCLQFLMLCQQFYIRLFQNSGENGFRASVDFFVFV